MSPLTSWLFVIGITLLVLMIAMVINDWRDNRR